MLKMKNSRRMLNNELVKPKVAYIFTATVLLLSISVANVSAQKFEELINKLESIDKRLSDLDKTQVDIQSAQGQAAVRQCNDEIADLSTLIAEIRLALASFKNTEVVDQPDQWDQKPPEAPNAKVEERAAMQVSPDNQAAMSIELFAATHGQRETSGGRGPDLVRQMASSPIGISGFGDFYSVAGPGSPDRDMVQIGQVEVDLETSIGESIAVGAALAYDSDSGNLGLGAFTIDLLLFGNDGVAFRKTDRANKIGVIAGQLDVPFGVDWQVYPSIDRKLIAAPIAVGNTHNSWNDYGVQLYVEDDRYNAVLYTTNGFNYEKETASGDQIIFESSAAIGGRLGFAVKGNIEIGSSHAGFFDENSDLGMGLHAVDIQAHFQQLSFKGEYILHRAELSGGDSVESTGFYAQGLYDFGQHYLVARMDEFQPDANADILKSLSLGGGWVLLEGAEIRLEYQINNPNDNRSLLQFVVGF